MSERPSLLTRVDSWFFAPQPVHAIAVTRIMFGTAMFLCYVFYTPWMEWYWGKDGLLTYLLGLKEPFTITQNALWPIYGLLLVSAAAFAVGFLTRWSGLCLLVCHYLFVRFGIYHTWGWAETIPVLIFYVSMSGAGRWLSVDAWLRRRRGLEVEPVASAWALRLVQIHVAMIYVAAGWHRIDDPGWIRGEMVYEAMSNTWYTRLPYVDFQPFKAVMSLATWGTEILELAAPVLLFVPRVRPWWMLGLIAMHTGLHLGASVGFWQPMMVASLITFADPRVIERIVRRTLPRTASARASS